MVRKSAMPECSHLVVKNCSGSERSLSTIDSIGSREPYTNARYVMIIISDYNGVSVIAVLTPHRGQEDRIVMYDLGQTPLVIPGE